MWLPNRSDTNPAAQSQKMARGSKFWSYVEEESYYPSSENKGADQLRGNREADLRLCFRQCKLFVFPWGCSYIKISHFFKQMAEIRSKESLLYMIHTIDPKYPNKNVFNSVDY